ncbi:hypothetical protein E6C27_scaffold270G001410 [Cucumis melo var. makuwa]|uniref:Uncharacterized protein n=1 Tax=Cucumis melo var. makuwa TaxID=1194695 RepID=A0A5A7T9L6_CUCMM|nr:hypothetical protein E6C27_scaffold270G001410 [Cucumis melo var. makuwa]
MGEETRQSLLYAIRSKEDTSSQTESFFDEDGINILNDGGSSNEEAFYSPSDSNSDEEAISCKEKCAGRCSSHINVITKDQETLFDLIEQLPDENSKRTCLFKLRQSVEEWNSQKTEKSSIIYSYQDILNQIKGEVKRSIQVEDLHSEVKVLKREVADNKQRLTLLKQVFQEFQEGQSSNEAPGTSSTNPERQFTGKALLIEEPGETSSINYIS